MHSFSKTMRDAFVKQLDNFNTDRVFPAWDAMMHRQQSALESLGVPAMYKTEYGSDRHVSCSRRLVDELNNLKSYISEATKNRSSPGGYYEWARSRGCLDAVELIFWYLIIDIARMSVACGLENNG